MDWEAHMELRQLEAFVTVTDAGSFTRAADRLSLTQPAVTRQVGALEQELGAKLLERMGRKVEPTAAGAALYDYASRILHLAAESRRAVADVAEGVAGRLRVGASSTAATYLLPSLLRRFGEMYPQVQLSVATGPSPSISQRAAAGAVDIGIVMDYQEQDGMDATILADYSLSLVVYPDHPLAMAHRDASGVASLAEIAEQPLIAMQRGATLRAFLEKTAADSGLPLRISMELDNVEAIKKMVQARLGVSVLPDIAIAAEVAAGLLVALPLRDAPGARQRIAAIRRRDKYLSAAMREFLRLLEAELPRTEARVGDADHAILNTTLPSPPLETNS
jgi:DNA-binding transcriptional LysR family regulator